MKLKLRPTDFRVREVLREGYLTHSGEHRVYRVTKRKLTSPEAASVLAAAAGVEVAQVSMAGLKDRQGVTVQYMSVPGGKRVELAEPDLRIEPVGSAERPLESTDSDGNAFEIAVRAVSRAEIGALRRNLPIVRESGVPNYFDDQRFGNLRYNQGWIAKGLMLGHHEEALRRLLTARSEREGMEDARFKSALEGAWGDFEKCFGISKRNGRHRSLFEHLLEHPSDFAGAFRYVATRIRLIHLYAWQSHVWNRAVAAKLRSLLPETERVVLRSLEGPLVCPRGAWPAAMPESITLPGQGLEDVQSAEEFDLLRDVLAEEHLTPGQHRIEGVEGFALKPEPRPVRVVPRHLRVRPAEPDREVRGASMVKLRFELPRGAYASLVVKRLLALDRGARDEHDDTGRAHGRRSDGRYDDERRDSGRDDGNDAPRHHGGRGAFERGEFGRDGHGTRGGGRQGDRRGSGHGGRRGGGHGDFRPPRRDDTGRRT